MPKSNNDLASKKPVKKAALGRGLGSLLGEPSPPKEIELSDDDFAFSKEPALKEGFIEEPVKPIPKATPKVKPKMVVEAKTQPQPQAQPKEVLTEVAQIPETMRIWDVAIEKIKPNKEQPRKEFEEEHILELSNSIKEKGILQPIVCRKLSENEFEIIAGERRWRAAQKAGLHEVPVILKEADDQNTLELALIENIQRKDLNPVEEAEAYSLLIKDYHLTQQEVANRVGKERATVANLLRLLQLSPEVRSMVSSEELSLGLAKVLLSVTDHKAQKALAKRIIKNNLTVRAAEKMVKRAREKSFSTEALSDIDVSKKLAEGLSQELQKHLGTKVNIDYNKGKGKITIHYYSDEELNQFVDKVRIAWQKQ